MVMKQILLILILPLLTSVDGASSVYDWSTEFALNLDTPRDHCEGRDRSGCSLGEYQSKLYGQCLPCRDTDDFAVLTGIQAAESFVWDTTKKNPSIFGVLWANASHGEMFGLGACQSQSSFTSYRECAITQFADPLPARAAKTEGLTILGFQVPFLYTIYDVSEDWLSSTGSFWIYGIFNSKHLGVYSQMTTPDPVNDPHRLHQHWHPTGPRGSYFKIIDASGKKTQYWDAFESQMGDRLYYRPMIGKRVVPPRIVWRFAFIFSIAALIALSSMWCGSDQDAEDTAKLTRKLTGRKKERPEDVLSDGTEWDSIDIGRSKSHTAGRTTLRGAMDAATTADTPKADDELVTKADDELAMVSSVPSSEHFVTPIVLASKKTSKPGFFGRMWGGIKSVSKGVWVGVKGATKAVVKGADWVVKKASGAVNSVIDKVQDTVEKVLPTPVSKVINGTIDTVQKIGGRTVGIITDAADTVTGVVEKVADKVEDVVESGTEKVEDAVTAVVDKAGDAVSWVGNKAKDTVKAILPSSIYNGFAWVGDKAKKGLIWIGDKTKNSVFWIGDKLKDAGNWVRNKFRGTFLGKLIDSVAEAPEKVKKFIDFITEKIKKFKNLVTERINGLIQFARVVGPQILVVTTFNIVWKLINGRYHESFATARLWLFWPILASLLVSMKKYETYEPCDGLTCCKEPNQWELLSWLEVIPYAALYFVPLMFGYYMAKRVSIFGCCCYKKDAEELEAKDEESEKGGKMPDSRAMRFVFVPLGFFIIIFHSAMIYSRVVQKHNIGTPWRVVCCTIGQMWTLNLISEHFKDVKEKYKELMWDFAKWLMFLMLVRSAFFVLNSNVEIGYFAMNSGCPMFNHTWVYGMMIFFALLEAMRMFYNFKSGCFKIVIILGIVIVAGIAIIVAPVNFCAGVDCEDVMPSDIGYGDSIWFAVSKRMATSLAKQGNPTGSVILVPNVNGSIPLDSVRQSWTGILTSPFDEDHSKQWRLAALAPQALFFFIRRFFPIVDRDVDFTEKQKIVWRHMQLDNELVPRNGYDLSHDDMSISQMAFAGFVAQKLEFANSTDKALAPKEVHIPEFKVDYSFMEGLEYREGYVPMGSVAYFDGNADLQFIRYMGETYTKAHENWEFAKFVFRSTGFTVTTLMDHLVGGHMKKSGMTTIHSRIELNSNHPLRRFIKPFTHDSIKINWAAKHSLFYRKAALGRAVALTPESFDKAVELTSGVVDFEDARAHWEFHRKVKSKTQHYAYGEDLVEYVQSVKPYVNAFVDAYWESDDDLRADAELFKFFKKILNKQNNVMQETLSKQTLKDYLAYFIFTVTAYHRHVGTVGDFTLDPTLSTGKIRPGATSGTVQGTIQIMSIAMATASPQVLLMKYSPEHLLLEDEHKATLMKGWRQMISNLEALEVKIHERNLKRRFRCTTFLPSVQGISIGV